MNPFSHNHGEVSETDLIAFHLHELPPRRERMVARALQHSAALAAESAAIEATLRTLKDTPRPIQQAAFNRTWAALEPALVPYAKPVLSTPRWRRTPAPAAAATVAVLAAVGAALFVIDHRAPTRRSKIAGPVTGTSATPSQESRSHSENRAADASEPSFPINTARLALPPQFPRARLTDSFQGSVGTGVYHPPQPGQLSPVHPLALSPVPTAPHPTPAEPLQSQPGFTANTLPPQPLTPLPSGASVSRTTTSQSSTPGKTRQRGPHTPRTTDLMLALGGTFLTPRSSSINASESFDESATHAIAAIAAFHQQFRPAFGYRLTVSYTRPDFQYAYAGTNSNGTYSLAGESNNRIYEAAVTYVVLGPHRRRLTTAVDAGAALMAFLPTQPSAASTSYVYCPAGVLGASAQYSIGSHWSARVTYRAQLFRSPDFRYAGGTTPVNTPIVLSNEPSVGIVYRFGKASAPASKP